MRIPSTGRGSLESKSYRFFSYATSGTSRVALKGTSRNAPELRTTTRILPSAAYMISSFESHSGLLTTNTSCPFVNWRPETQRLLRPPDVAM